MGKPSERNIWRKRNDVATWQDPVLNQTEEEKEDLTSSVIHPTRLGHLGHPNKPVMVLFSVQNL